MRVRLVWPQSIRVEGKRTHCVTNW